MNGTLATTSRKIGSRVLRAALAAALLATPVAFAAYADSLWLAVAIIGVASVMTGLAVMVLRRIAHGAGL